jgi:RNA polymerase sigma-70 factor (ECF subfamily)
MRFRLQLPTRKAERLRRLADEELMELVGSRRDTDAFGVVLERHADAAYSLAYRILGNQESAEDVLQEAFLALWRHGSYDHSKGSVRTWILSIVHHRAVDTLRRKGARPTHAVDADELLRNRPAKERTEETVASRESTARLRSALELLPEEQRQVVELAYFGGFTHAEIAALSDLPIGTVKGRMRLALKKLRDELEEEVW